MIFPSHHATASTTSIGALPIAPPLAGWWTLPDFPERVMIEGRLFRRAAWRQAYEGVVEQYREERAQDSMHLKVFGDGRWIVDHTDDDNPDLGRPLPHFFNDHPVGKFVKNVAPIVGAGILLFLSARVLARS